MEFPPMGAGGTIDSRPAQQSIAIGDEARDRRDWEAAAAAYRAAVEADPSLKDIWVQYGHALKESGRAPEAEAAYRQALALDAGIADTHLQLGHVLKLQRRFTEAMACYLTCADLAPEMEEATREALGLRGIGEVISEERLDRLIKGCAAPLLERVEDSSQSLRVLFDALAREPMPLSVISAVESAAILNASDVLNDIAGRLRLAPQQ